MDYKVRNYCRATAALVSVLLSACFLKYAEAIRLSESMTGKVMQIGVLNEQSVVHESQQHEHIEHWVITILFLIILTVSLVFELLLHALQHTLEHRKLSSLMKMMNAVYKELTILGFISITLFTLVRTGIVQKINDRVFGVSETEAVAIQEAEEEGETPVPPTTLTEVFEEVHILVFLIMCTFIIGSGVLLVFGNRVINSMKYLDEKTEEDLRNDIRDAGARVNERHLNEALEFYGVKQRFLKPKEVVIPRPKDMPLGYSKFSFTNYLGSNFGDLLTELIELPPSSLVVLLIIVALLRPAMGLHGVEPIICMIFLAFCLLALSALLAAYVDYLYSKLKPDAQRIKIYLAQSQPGDTARAAALECPIDAKPIAQKMFWGKVCNRATSLIPFGKPSYLLRVTQLIFFFHAVYIAILLKDIITTAHGSSTIWWVHAAWSYTLTFLTIGASLFLWSKLIRKYSLVTSIDFLASNEKIRRVEAEADHSVLQRDGQILEFLLHQAEKAMQGKQVQVQRMVSEFNKLNKPTQDSVEGIFRSMSYGTPASVNRKDVYEIFRALNLYGPGDKDSVLFVNEWFDILDVPRLGTLQFDQFKVLIMLAKRLLVSKADIPGKNEEHLKKLFTELDADGTGKVSLNEIMQALSGMSPPISPREASDLLKRMSPSGGEVNFKEVHEWARKVQIRNEITSVAGLAH